MKRGLMLRSGCYGLGLLLVAGLLSSCAGTRQARKEPPAPVVEAVQEEVPAKEAPAAPPVLPVPPVPPVLSSSGVPVLEARPSGAAPAAGAEEIFPYPPRFLRDNGGGEGLVHTPGLENLLAEISREVAGKVYYDLRERDKGSLSPRLAVVVAVPLSDLKRESEFGRVLAEYLLTDLADRGLAVTELRLGREIHIIPQTGEFILSRNIGELASNQQELDYVVVSTYSNTRRTLMVHGRLVDPKNGEIRSSWRHTLPLNRELLGLFQEAEGPFTISVRGIL